MYDILIYVLKAWTQKQDSALLYALRSKCQVAVFVVECRHSSFNFLKSITILHICLPDTSNFLGTTQIGAL